VRTAVRYVRDAEPADTTGPRFNFQLVILRWLGNKNLGRKWLTRGGDVTCCEFSCGRERGMHHLDGYEAVSVQRMWS
jgi:hypothetical protein